MRIKSFELGGHKIKIKYVKSIQDTDGRNLFGTANPKTNTIHIATFIQEEPLSEDVIHHSVYHELAHFFMMIMYEHKLNSNEKFIDNLGLLLHQFMKTKK
jgi:hypothetical protein